MDSTQKSTLHSKAGDQAAWRSLKLVGVGDASSVVGSVESEGNKTIRRERRNPQLKTREGAKSNGMVQRLQ